jgi:hypothetical protein
LTLLEQKVRHSIEESGLLLLIRRIGRRGSVLRGNVPSRVLNHFHRLLQRQGIEYTVESL